MDLKSTFEQLLIDLNDTISGTRCYITTTELILSDPYQQIIGLGPDVLPLLFNHLTVSNGSIFSHALRSITRINPAHGILDNQDARTKWIVWGRQHGYISEPIEPKPGEYWMDGNNKVWLLDERGGAYYTLQASGTHRTWAADGKFCYGAIGANDLLFKVNVTLAAG